MNAVKKILVVDDEPHIVKVVCKRLELSGFSVSVAVDGEEALRAVQTERPDLIVLDLMLPKLSGFEVCERLKQSADTRRIPVVILSAKTQEESEHRARAAGADAFFRKPFQATELLSAIRGLLAAGTPAPRAGDAVRHDSQEGGAGGPPTSSAGGAS